VTVRTGTGAATSPGAARKLKGMPKPVALRRMTPPGDMAACMGREGLSRASWAPGIALPGVQALTTAPSGAPGKKGLPDAPGGVARIAAVPFARRLMVMEGRPPGDM